MNWTGGRLNRHIKANANERVRLQKQHFAKARQEIQYPSSATQPTFSILGQYQSAPSLTTSDFKHAHHRITSHARLGQSEILNPALIGANPRIRGSDQVASPQDLRQGLHTLSCPSLTCATGSNKTTTLSTTLSMIFLPVQTGLVSQ